MLSTSDNELICRTDAGTPMGELFRRFWLPALLPSELPEPDCAPVRFRILGEDLIAFRNTDGEVAFVAQACPHRGASLFFGRNEENGLRCVYHGWKFDVNGDCVDMPSEPAESNFKTRCASRRTPASSGRHRLDLHGPEAPPARAPAVRLGVSPTPQQHVYKWRQESNYLQGLEGNLDSAHVSFLHRWLKGADACPTSSSMARPS